MGDYSYRRPSCSTLDMQRGTLCSILLGRKQTFKRKEKVLVLLLVLVLWFDARVLGPVLVPVLVPVFIACVGACVGACVDACVDAHLR